MRFPAARRVPALAVALLSVLVLAAGAGPAGAVQPADAPTTTMRIAVGPDGDARWSIVARFALDSANETRAFDRLAAEFEAGEADVLSVTPFRRAAALAGNATGRPMAIRNVSRTARRANGTGRLVLAFTWTAFANTSGDRIAVGDAFTTPSGDTWLPRLTEHQELIVRFPSGYTIVDASHPLQDRSFHIRGPATFEPGEPSATLVRRPSTPTESETRTPTTTTPTTTTGANGVTTTRTPTPTGGVLPALGLGALAVLIGALALLVERRRRRDVGGAPPSDDGPPADGGAGAADVAAEPPSDDGPPADGGAGAADVAAEPPSDASDADEPDDAALLSDEERVLRLLSEHDGRMKQARIVEETDWSNAKVSQLLSEMAENGDVEKLRLGRENLISLPDEAPDEPG